MLAQPARRPDQGLVLLRWWRIPVIRGRWWRSLHGVKPWWSEEAGQRVSWRRSLQAEARLILTDVAAVEMDFRNPRARSHSDRDRRRVPSPQLPRGIDGSQSGGRMRLRRCHREEGRPSGAQFDAEAILAWLGRHDGQQGLDEGPKRSHLFLRTDPQGRGPGGSGSFHVRRTPRTGKIFASPTAVQMLV